MESRDLKKLDEKSNELFEKTMRERKKRPDGVYKVVYKGVHCYALYNSDLGKWMVAHRSELLDDSDLDGIAEERPYMIPVENINPLVSPFLDETRAWLNSIDSIEEARKIIAEQALTIVRQNKKIKNLEDAEFRHMQWVRQAKRDAGYDNSISFDIVWEDTLKKSKKVIQ